MRSRPPDNQTKKFFASQKRKRKTQTKKPMQIMHIISCFVYQSHTLFTGDNCTLWKMDEEFNIVVGQHKRIYGAHVGDLNRSHVWVCVWQQLLCVFSLVQVVTLKGHPCLVRKSWVVASLQQQQPTPSWGWALKPKSSFRQVLYENFFVSWWNEIFKTQKWSDFGSFP
jgi:hypothetical protein